MPVRTLAVDVDYTIINSKDEMYPGVAEKLKEWAVRYTTLICWSHSGGDHAKRVCRKHKIDKHFTHFLDKPDVIVDDRPESIIEFPAVLEVKDPKKWWLREDSALFKNSRHWVDRYKEHLGAVVKEDTDES